MSLSIDVVIPAYNRWDLTSSCLTHLAAQTVPHRVIVVDNGSSDETAEMLREWDHVQVVSLRHNRAFTTAVNLGVAAGEGDVVVLMNNDVDLRPDCLERLVAPLLRDAGVGAVASVMLRPGEHEIDSVGVTSDVTLAGFPRLQGLPATRAPESAPVLTGAEGTTAAYRRTAWEQVGGLDETITAYMEILDLAWRLRAAGWRAASAPDAIGVHLGSATFGRRSPRQRRLAGFSRAYLLRRYGVLRTRHAPRTLFTEVSVVALDALITHDLDALRGRVEGWRAARGMPRREHPPAEAIDRAITLRRSLQLRRGSAGS